MITFYIMMCCKYKDQELLIIPQDMQNEMIQMTQ